MHLIAHRAARSIVAGAMLLLPPAARGGAQLTPTPPLLDGPPEARAGERGTRTRDRDTVTPRLHAALGDVAGASGGPAARTVVADSAHTVMNAVALAPARHRDAQVPPAGQPPRPPGTPIEVGEDRLVGLGVGGVPLVEPHLAADPRKAGHLVGGVIVITKPDLTERACAALASFDTGRTWVRHDFAVKGCGDPYAAVLPDGSALLAMLGDAGSGKGLLVFRSPDGGRTWGDRPVTFAGDHDHGTLAIDTTRGPLAGSVYAVFQGSARDAAGRRRPAALVARSSDGGTSFGAPVPVIMGNLWMTAMNPVVLSDGTLVVSFANFGRMMADGQFAWLTRELDWAVTSADGGQTFSVPLFVSDACGRTFPVLAVDASGGPYRDRLYWLCNDRPFGHAYLQYSPDHGATWSDPTPANEGSGREPYVRTAAVAVNRDGVIGVSWYDGRGDQTGDVAFRCQEVFFTASLDGGRTFLPEVKVSSGRNCPVTPHNGEAGRRWPAGGDYHGLAAAADGRFHVVWADSRGGIYQLRAVSIRVGARATARAEVPARAGIR